MKKLFIYSILLITIFSSCLDPCRKTKCTNGGTCFDGTCECPLGYEGKNCETEMRDKFIGTFNGTTTIVGEKPENDKITISARASVTEIKILFENTYLVGNITSSNSFIIKNQYVEPKVSIDGKGTIKGNTIFINFTIYEQGFPNEFIDFEGTK